MTTRLLLAALALLLAAAPPAAAQPAGGGLYVVQAGDTLFRIARANGLSIDELKELNRIDGNAISVGQTLRLSASAQAPAAGTAPEIQAPPIGVGIDVPGTPTPDAPAPNADVVHVVAPGETLFRIALRYDTSVDALRRLNAIRGDQIEVGQRLVVGRGGGRTAGPALGGPRALNPTNRWAIDNTTVPSDLVHYVEPGETLYSVAALRGVPLADLIANNALTTAPLEPGQILYLPVAARPRLLEEAPLPALDDSGLALVYPDVMAGRTTASGEAYDPLQFTASHRTLPFGTVLLVTNPASGRTTFVRVIDRGPISQAYLIELSAAAASAIELDPNAARRVDVRRMP